MKSNKTSFPSLKNNNETLVQCGGDELFQAIQDPVLVTTPQGVILEANLAAINASRKSKEEIIGKGICQIIHGGKWPHIKCPLEEFLLTCQPQVQETKLPGFGGDYLLTISPVKEADGQVLKILLVARELTMDEKRRVDTMRTAQLASLGELAAGVAHEVNNPINGIINFAQLLLDDGGLNYTQEELLERIVNEGERVATIIRKLLSFARDSYDESDVIDLQMVVAESLALVQHQLKKESIIVKKEFHAKSSMIKGNFRQLQQVFLNFLSNSKYALNERFPKQHKNKRIDFSCREFKRDGNKWVAMVVKDYGTGIPQGILDRLFDPFFSTKPTGKGTGLGLSISYSIVKNHGGTIRVNSVLDQFTEMIVEIPAYQTENH